MSNQPSKEMDTLMSLYTVIDDKGYVVPTTLESIAEFGISNDTIPITTQSILNIELLDDDGELWTVLEPDPTGDELNYVLVRESDSKALTLSTNLVESTHYVKNVLKLDSLSLQLNLNSENVLKLNYRDQQTGEIYKIVDAGKYYLLNLSGTGSQLEWSAMPTLKDVVISISHLVNVTGRFVPTQLK